MSVSVLWTQHRSVRLLMYFGLTAILALGGCQTTGAPGVPPGSSADASPATGPARISKTNYNLFSDQGDHLKELLEVGHTDDAAKLYEEQLAFFDQNMAKENVNTLLVRLAENLMSPRREAIAVATAALSPLSWPQPQAAWPSMRTAMTAAKTALDDYDSFTLLKNPKYRHAEAIRLQESFDRLASQMHDAADAQFSAFDHFGPDSFFGAYPLAALDRQPVLEANWSVIEARLNTAKADQLRRFFVNNPADTLGEARLKRVSDAYASALLKEGGKPSLKSSLQAHRRAEQDGFRPSTLKGGVIGFVEVTSPSLLNNGKIDFPAEIKVDLPVEVAKAEIEQALDPARNNGVDFLVVLNVAMAKAERRVNKMDAIPSTALTGYSKEINPEYDAAQIAYDEARMNVATTQSQANSNKMSRVFNPAPLADLGDNIAIFGAKSTMDEAKTKLLATPRTIDVPVYADYKFSRASVQATKTMTVHYYVLDHKGRTYLKNTFDVVENQNFSVLYNVQDNDPNKDKHFAEADQESDLADWEKAPVTVKLSSLVDHYLATSSAAAKLPDVALIKKDIIADRNAALSSADNRSYTQARDSRFESVVAIYNPNGGLGSGFYIRPDVILTNHHVVGDGKFMEMKMHDGRETFGKVIAYDARLDLALIKVQDQGKPVAFYDQPSLPVGATVEVIGHPKGYEFSITRGIVSAIRKENPVQLGGGDQVTFVQIDAPTSPGNSGGPVFMNNQVVAVIDWVNIEQHAQNLNFSIHYGEVLTFIRKELGG